MTWHARLDLAYALRADGKTTLSRQHLGPLMVQKALYPEGEHICHSIIVHPPGGIAGGDHLSLNASVGHGAHAVITTPGATRWYKSGGTPAAQHIHLHVAGMLEWLPQETLVFDAAQIDSQIHLDVADQAATLGWDIVALGRSASGERFTTGCFAQTITFKQGETTLWIERTRLEGGDLLLDSPVGLGGHTVFGCFWAYGPLWTDVLYEQVREQVCGAAADHPARRGLHEAVQRANGEIRPRSSSSSATGQVGLALTRLSPRLLVARACGNGTEAVRRAFMALWQVVREPVAGVAAQAPRIWAT